jgi:plastocyanin
MRSLRSRVGVLATAAVLSLGLAACGGDDGGEAATPTVEPDVSVTGTDALKYDPDALEADAGEIAIGLTAGESVEHNLVVEGVDGDAPVVEVNKGATSVGTVELEPGEYTFYCSIPGHRTAGMEGTLTVE